MSSELIDCVAFVKKWGYTEDSYKEIGRSLISNKTVQDIVNHLKTNFKLTCILNESAYVPLFKNNIINSYKNKYNKLSLDNLKVKMYEVHLDANSKNYYLDANRECFPPQQLRVYLEHKSRTVESNSKLLQLELSVMLGITEFEYRNNMYIDQWMHLSGFVEKLDGKYKKLMEEGRPSMDASEAGVEFSMLVTPVAGAVPPSQPQANQGLTSL